MSESRPGALLEVRHLEAAYGAVQVLWGVSFAVPRGQVVCILGSNGAGKTTALHCVAGVLPPRKGQIIFDGQDVTSDATHQRVRRQISLVPEGRHLWPMMNVEENLRLGAFLREVRLRAESNLARVYELFPRLKERRNQLAGTLSGGEQQMCAIGRGLMAEPKLLMLDEPTLGLAPRLVDEIYDFIRAIAQQGMTLLLVGQNVHDTLRVAQHGYIMETGRIALEGSSASLLGNPYMQEAYLGSAAPSGA